MKGLIVSFMHQGRTLSLGLFALVFVGLTAESGAQVVTLTSINSTAQVNLSSSAGLSSWQVDGVNQLQQQWFWYRVGATGPESDLSAITTSPTYSTSFGGRELDALYANATFGISVRYLLSGNTVGTGKSGINETVQIFNYSGATLDFHLFGYSHFTLAGTANNQNVQILPLTGANEAIQTIGPISGSAPSLTETTLGSVAATRVEAAAYSQTLSELTDGLATTLNNITSAGPGNPTFAFQWDLSIAPGQSSGIFGKLDQVQVPEPSTWALLSLGVMVFILAYRHGNPKNAHEIEL
jgi:hypothetical protein